MKTNVTDMPTALHRALPDYTFHEIHRIAFTESIQSLPDLVKGLTWQEVPGFHRVITAAGLGLHRFDPCDTVLSMFLNGPYRILSERPHEIVLGASLSTSSAVSTQPDDATTTPLNAFQRNSTGGTVKVATNFIARGGFLWTETRTLPVGRIATTLFTPYWYGIRLGGGFIRRSWLKGLKTRATRKSGRGTVGR